MYMKETCMRPRFGAAVAIALVLTLQHACAKDIPVGGNAGWTLGVQYHPINATAGDTLVIV